MSTLVRAISDIRIVTHSRMYLWCPFIESVEKLFEGREEVPFQQFAIESGNFRRPPAYIYTEEELKKVKRNPREYFLLRDRNNVGELSFKDMVVTNHRYVPK